MSTPENDLSNASLLNDDLDTSEKRKNWWNQLESQLKLAFKQSLWSFLDNEQEPNDFELTDLMTRPALRFVGPMGTNLNMSFPLT